MLKIYEDVGFAIIAVGFSIGVYSIYFTTMKNHVWGYILSWVTIIITVPIVEYVGDKSEFFRNNSVVYSVTAAPVIHKIVAFVSQVIFNVPRD